MNPKKFFNLCLALVLLAQTETAFAQTADFKQVVEERLKTRYNSSLAKVCPIETDQTAARIFLEYGAIFISNNTILPGQCIFTNEAALQSFQAQSQPQSAKIGGVVIELQKPAMESFLKARQEAAKKNLPITPNRGTSSSARRSFAQTVAFWNGKVNAGLNHWVAKRRISKAEAANARALPIREQIAQILEWEKEGIYFSLLFDKSILYSVAAPGASQHNFLLALDIAQYANKETRRILGEHGWFQTVLSDKPHFTYLGVKESELPALGLKAVTVDGQKYWIPDLKQ